MVADTLDKVSAKSLPQKCFGGRWPPQPSSLDLYGPWRGASDNFGDNGPTWIHTRVYSPPRASRSESSTSRMLTHPQCSCRCCAEIVKANETVGIGNL